jgi:DNA-binding PadR family transcriptional regulator
VPADDHGEQAKGVIMNDSFGADRFGANHHGFGSGAPGANGIWEAVDHLREMFEQRVGTAMGGGSTPTTRMGKGDVREAILALLAEQPMHGYQIIRQIDERSGGAWKLSPGSVYPTLQLLADEGLITAEESGGRKTYSLTDAGEQAAAASTGSAPWEAPAARSASPATVLPKAGAKLAQAVAQVGQGGSPEQVQQAVDVLDEARRKIYSILAQD